MYIEPGIVTGARLVLSYATGIATGRIVAKLVVETIRERGALSFALQAIAATGLVFGFGAGLLAMLWLGVFRHPKCK